MKLTSVRRYSVDIFKKKIRPSFSSRPRILKSDRLMVGIF